MSATSQRESGVECGNCGCTRRRPDTNRCAACGRYAEDPLYAKSPVTGKWYRVTEYDEVGEGKIKAKSKEEVSREEVPQRFIDAAEEGS